MKKLLHAVHFKHQKKGITLGLIVVGLLTIFIGAALIFHKSIAGKQKANVLLPTITATIVPTPDTIPPILEALTTIEKNSATVTLKEASVSAKNIQIFDTKPSKVIFALQFSELGHLSIASVSGVTLQWSEEATKSAIVTLPSGQKPFKTQYRITDMAGLFTEGTLSYYYDNVGPSITLISSTNLTNKWGMGYAVMFKPSEAISSSYVTFKGQQVPTHSTINGEYSGTITLDMGANIFSITATDLNNNTTTKTYTVTISQDSDPVAFPPSQPAFRRCSDDMRNTCTSKTGWDYSSSDCTKFEAYKACLKEVCDNTTATNVCP